MTEEAAYRMEKDNFGCCKSDRGLASRLEKEPKKLKTTKRNNVVKNGA